MHICMSNFYITDFAEYCRVRSQLISTGNPSKMTRLAKAVSDAMRQFVLR